MEAMLYDFLASLTRQEKRLTNTQTNAIHSLRKTFKKHTRTKTRRKKEEGERLTLRKRMESGVRGQGGGGGRGFFVHRGSEASEVISLQLISVSTN